MKEIGQLRLVCKAWRSCIHEYPGDIGCQFKEDIYKTACSMMPNMTSIRIWDDQYEGIDLAALGNCNFLTSVDLSVTSKFGCQDYTEPLELQYLPATVKDIRVNSIYVASNSYEMMNSANAKAITRLDCCKSDYNPGYVWSWLDYLPNLQRPRKVRLASQLDPLSTQQTCSFLFLERPLHAVKEIHQDSVPLCNVDQNPMSP